MIDKRALWFLFVVLASAFAVIGIMFWLSG